MHRRDVIRALALAGGGSVMGAGRAWAVAGAGSGAGAAKDGRVFVARIALLGSRVVTDVTIGGAGPFSFAIDTGGFLSLIDEDFARSLKMPNTGITQARGVGGRATLPLYLARDIVFGGGLRQPTVAFAAVDLGFKGPIKGMLAAGIMTTLDSDLDIEAGEWRVYPDGHPPREGYVRIDNAISDTASGRGAQTGSRHLYGDATVDGRRMRFLLDTGAPGGVSIDQPAARALGLWNDARPYAPTRPSGIGGPAGIARIVRGGSFTFGGAAFERPLVMLRGAGDTRGQGVQGIIGLQVLRRFNLSTDVRARALWVKRHGAGGGTGGTGGTGETGERYGLSGLWIDHQGDR